MSNKNYAPRALKPEDMKYYVVLFTLTGHTTWRGMFAPKIDILEKQLKQFSSKVTAKKFFEIDRLTGSFEEF